MNKTSRLRGVLRGAGTGAVAGLIGGAVMVGSEKIEQALTHRRNSYVPARALLTLVGDHPSDTATPVVWNHLMHYTTAATLGALRGVWAITGIRGGYANAWHVAIRLGFDQTIENATGVGAPPASWPAREKLVDVGHKAVFSTVTGMLADRWLAPVAGSGAGL